MFEIATMTVDNKVKLPETIANRFLPSDRFVVWMENNTLHLKRIEPSVLDLVDQAPADEPMSLEDINEIVHEVRSRRSM